MGSGMTRNGLRYDTKLLHLSESLLAAQVGPPKQWCLHGRFLPGRPSPSQDSFLLKALHYTFYHCCSMTLWPILNGHSRCALLCANPAYLLLSEKVGIAGLLSILLFFSLCSGIAVFAAEWQFLRKQDVTVRHIGQLLSWRHDAAKGQPCGSHHVIIVDGNPEASREGLRTEK